MTERRDAWESRYREGKTGWDRGEPSPALQHWMAHARRPSGRVLVPGCGDGHEVIDLARAGLQVTAIDIAAQPLMRLTGRLVDEGLHARVIQADLLHWQPAEPFDAVYEQTSLCAFEPGLWPAYEQRLAHWLLPGGVLFALFMQTGRDGGPPFDCPVTSMRDLFDPSRWDWQDAGVLRVPHPNGFDELGHLLVRR
jgi:SAM-dependent methyltransferase